MASGLERRCGPRFSPPRDSPTSTCSFLGLRQAPPEAQDQRQLQGNPVPGPRLPSRYLGTRVGKKTRHQPSCGKTPALLGASPEAEMLSAGSRLHHDPPLRSRPALLPRPPPLLPTLSVGPLPARRPSPASPPRPRPERGALRELWFRAQGQRRRGAAARGLQPRRLLSLLGLGSTAVGAARARRVPKHRRCGRGDAAAPPGSLIPVPKCSASPAQP